MNTITKEQYNEIKTRLAAYEVWRNGRTSYPSNTVPPGLGVSNEDRSKVELYDFVHNPPEKYFVYVRHDAKSARQAEATTWMGELLGCAMLGYEWRDNFGGTRRSIEFAGVNGFQYVGTYYTSSGDYARVRMTAQSKRRLAARQQINSNTL